MPSKTPTAARDVARYPDHERYGVRDEKGQERDAMRVDQHVQARAGGDHVDDGNQQLQKRRRAAR